jgi:hypothetical protein
LEISTGKKEKFGKKEKMKVLNLFGEMQEMELPKKPYPPSVYQQFKINNHYRLGTKERRCKLCEHSRRKVLAKTYYKCVMMGCSSSPASDIRLKNVCDKFEKDENTEN